MSAKRLSLNALQGLKPFQMVRNILKQQQDDEEFIDLQVGKTVWYNVQRKMRVELWMSVLHRKGIGSGAAKKFPAMLEEANNLPEVTLQDIDKDTGRTFPDVPRFACAAGRASLANVLRAYAAFDPEVGYCQGMNFLAGLLLCWLTDEADAFGGMVVLMFDRQLREVYKQDMAMLQVRLWQFGSLVPRALGAHLEAVGALAVLYVSSWLLTCYAASFPLAFCSRVMDVVLTDSYPHAMMKVALALLKRAESRLLQLRDMEAVVELLKSEVPCWPKETLQQVLTDALRTPWTPAQRAVIDQVDGAESVIEAVARVDRGPPEEPEAATDGATAAPGPRPISHETRSLSLNITPPPRSQSGLPGRQLVHTMSEFKALQATRRATGDAAGPSARPSRASESGAPLPSSQARRTADVVLSPASLPALPPSPMAGVGLASHVVDLMDFHTSANSSPVQPSAGAGPSEQPSPSIPSSGGSAVRALNGHASSGGPVRAGGSVSSPGGLRRVEGTQAPVVLAGLEGLGPDLLFSLNTPSRGPPPSTFSSGNLTPSASASTSGVRGSGSGSSLSSVALPSSSSALSVAQAGRSRAAAAERSRTLRHQLSSDSDINYMLERSDTVDSATVDAAAASMGVEHVVLAEEWSEDVDEAWAAFADAPQQAAGGSGQQSSATSSSRPMGAAGRVGNAALVGAGDRQASGASSSCSFSDFAGAEAMASDAARAKFGRFYDPSDPWQQAMLREEAEQRAAVARGQHSGYPGRLSPQPQRPGTGHLRLGAEQRRNTLEQQQIDAFMQFSLNLRLDQS